MATDTIQPAMTPSEEIDVRIAGLAGWRGALLANLRALILAAEPEIVETVKWRKPTNGMRGVPVWDCTGMICTGETYKDKIKLTFMHGAALPDPEGLFNAGLQGGTRRAIDLFEGDTVNQAAFQDLIRAAASFNHAKNRR